ncbi:MAG: ABC transporter permease [Sciscionella sp.]
MGIAHTGLASDIGQFFQHNPGLLLSEAIGHIELSAISVAVALVIGLPIGAVVGHLHKFSFLAVSGGNVLRALPTLSVISVGIGIYGFGLTNILVAMVILALPLVLTNTYVAVEGVDPGTVEAARGMGLTGWQILWRVELPNSIPLVMAGVRTSWVYVVATAYLAGFAGYPGTLGDIITSVGAYGLGGVLAAAAVAIVIAFAGDFILVAIQRMLTPAGLKIVPVAVAA